MKNVSLVPKDVQIIVSSHKILEKYNEQKMLHKKTILQYSQKNTCFGVSFMIKMQVFSPATLLKRDSNTGVSLQILRNF